MEVVGLIVVLTIMQDGFSACMNTQKGRMGNVACTPLYRGYPRRTHARLEGSGAVPASRICDACTCLAQSLTQHTATIPFLDRSLAACPVGLCRRAAALPRVVWDDVFATA